LLHYLHEAAIGAKIIEVSENDKVSTDRIEFSVKVAASGGGTIIEACRLSSRPEPDQVCRSPSVRLMDEVCRVSYYIVQAFSGAPPLTLGAPRFFNRGVLEHHDH